MCVSSVSKNTSNIPAWEQSTNSQAHCDYIFKEEILATNDITEFDETFTARTIENIEASEDEDPSFEKKGTQKRNFTKLELISAKEIKSLLRYMNIAFFLGITGCITNVILTWTEFSVFDPFKKNKSYVYSKGYDMFQNILSIITFAYAVGLSITYTLRLLRTPAENRTHEQSWIIILIFSVVFYLAPFNAIVAFSSSKYEGYTDSIVNFTWYPALRLFILFNMAEPAFMVASLFYIWSTLHSYRVLQGALPTLFMVKKLASVWILFEVKQICGMLLHVYTSAVPFISFFVMFRIFSITGVWVSEVAITVSVITVLEIITVTFIFREFFATKKLLNRSDYLLYRAKQVGFRFFLYSTLVFAFFYWSMYLILLVARPWGSQELNVKGKQYYLFLTEAPSGLYVIALIYATVESYVKLPADAFGFRGWFMEAKNLADYQHMDNEDLQPLVYRKREPHSFTGVANFLHSNVFVMQTQVLLFNFSWYVYYYGTKKVENFEPTQDVISFQVADYISDKVTDTHVLVIDGSDRIIVAFRGTTSLKNLKTDLNINQVCANEVLPSRLIPFGHETAFDHSTFDYSLLHGREWKRAKIHKGFARAYKSISDQLIDSIDKLYRKRPRPFYLTGHSLGGSLATLCSLDIAACLNIPSKEILVSTFGAPRLGNRSYVEIYNRAVPITWRIILAPDMIPKIPRFGYKHVGKKALLTSSGDLFLDPDALELKLWHGDAASMLYHRKASYLLAMRQWCATHHGEAYIPEFWEWPFSEDDSRRFDARSTRSSDLRTPGSNWDEENVVGVDEKNQIPKPEKSYVKQSRTSLIMKRTQAVDQLIDSSALKNEQQGLHESLDMTDEILVQDDQTPNHDGPSSDAKV